MTKEQYEQLKVIEYRIDELEKHKEMCERDFYVTVGSRDCHTSEKACMFGTWDFVNRRISECYEGIKADLNKELEAERKKFKELLIQ